MAAGAQGGSYADAALDLQIEPFWPKAEYVEGAAHCR
jgi:hypothetical protein